MAQRIMAKILTAIMLVCAAYTGLLAQEDGLSGNLIINRGSRITNDANKEVNLAIQAKGAVFMMVSNNGSFIGAQWQKYESFIQKWKLAGEDGRKSVFVQLKDAKGNLSDVVSAEIILDREPPLGMAIMINDGQQYTGNISKLVRLDLDATDAFQMRVSNRSDFLGAAWIPYQKRMGSWRLTAQPGEKEVFFQTRDRANNLSNVVSSKITLDYIAPGQCGVTIENGAIYTNKTAVKVKLAANGASEAIFRGGDGWFPFKEEVEYELTAGDGEKEVAVKFRDESGNQSVVVFDKIILDTQPPMNGMIVLNGNSKYTKEPANIHVELFAAGASEMMISNNADFKDAQWRPFATAINSWVVSSENGDKIVYVKYRDKAGNETEVFSDDVTLDNLPPTAPFVAIESAGAVYDTIQRAHIIKSEAKLVDLKISATDAEFMMISNTNTFFGVSWQRYAEIVEGWELGGDNDGSRSVFVRFMDKAQNVSEMASDRVIVDTEPPLDTKVFIRGEDMENRFCIHPEAQAKVQLFARNAHQIMLADDSSFNGATWEAYQEFKTWTLAGDDGVKRVYAKFRDLVGNESKIAFDDIILDRRPPHTASIILNKGEKSTNNPDRVVLLKVKATDATAMQVSNSPEFDKRWIGYSELNINWPLSNGDGSKAVYVRFRDEAGNISEMISDSIVLDRTPPLAGTVNIDDGAKITNNANKKVTLTISATGAKEMRIGNNFLFDDKEIVWEPYSTAKEWILAGADGQKTVCVQFKDELGNISPIAFHRIGVDREAPRDGKIEINRGATFCTDINKRVNLVISVKEAKEIMVSNDPNFPGVSWKPLEPLLQNWILDGDDGEKIVYAKFRDLAGNESQTQAKITLDRQEPIGERIVINGGAPITNDKFQKVRLELNAEGAVEMMIADDAYFGHPAKWQPYKKDLEWTLKGRDGEKTVYVKFRDVAGNESTVVNANVKLDTEAPIMRGMRINGAKTGTESRVVTLTMDVKGADFMMISDDPKFEGATWEPFSAERSWTLSGGPGLKRVFVKFKDHAENATGHTFSEITLYDGTE